MVALLAGATSIMSCVAQSAPVTDQKRTVQSGGTAVVSTKSGTEQAVLGGGCFWCLEAAFEVVPGVVDVQSGYSGGTRDNPSYEEVSSGLTGHAEVVRIEYDPARVSYATLLELYFKIHDPTSLNRQGADIGTQYRSIILYASEEQKRVAEEAIKALQPKLSRPIVTEVQPLVRFWLAEEYHQDFFKKNPDYGYCQVIVAPKVEKARSFVDALTPVNANK